eukprot:scaffold7695_cov124-Isochrysis_galbana.AAC.19
MLVNDPTKYQISPRIKQKLIHSPLKGKPRLGHHPSAKDGLNKEKGWGMNGKGERGSDRTAKGQSVSRCSAESPLVCSVFFLRFFFMSGDIWMDELTNIPRARGPRGLPIA